VGFYHETNLKATGSVKTKWRRDTVFLLGAEAFGGGTMVGWSGVAALGEFLGLLVAWLPEDT